MAYVKRLQTAEDSSSCSESDQSFRSSGIYSGKEDCTFSDSESSKIDAMEPADILHDSDSSGSVSNRAIQQLSGKQITVTDTEEFGSPLNAPSCFTTGIDFVAEDSNRHADKLMDECTKLGSAWMHSLMGSLGFQGGQPEFLPQSWESCSGVQILYRTGIPRSSTRDNDWLR